MLKWNCLHIPKHFLLFCTPALARSLVPLLLVSEVGCELDWEATAMLLMLVTKEDSGRSYGSWGREAMTSLLQGPYISTAWGTVVSYSSCKASVFFPFHTG